MMMSSEQSGRQHRGLNDFVSQQKKQGFELIWYYWYLKNIVTKNVSSPTKQGRSPLPKQKQKQSQPQRQSSSQIISSHPHQRKPLSLSTIQSLLRPFRQSYHMQTIEPHLQHNLNTIKQRALLSRNDRFFVIQPEQQIHQIEYQIRNSSINLKNGLQLQTCLEDMLIELFSYYLNSKNVYLIYKGTSETLSNNQHYQNNSISSSIDSTQNRLKMILTHNSSQSRLNTSKDSKGSLKHQRNRSYGSLKSSLIIPNHNTASKLLEDDSIMMTPNNPGQSLMADGEKMENKIQQLEVIDKLADFDGMQLWNIKYKKIPHTFVKFKKQSWTKCLNLPMMHPAAPKTINEFPILPRVTRLNHSIDKLLPFVSFIKMLEKFFPNLLPSIDSIFQYNGMPYVFLEEDNGYGSWKWETNIGVLCYYVVYGNQEETLSIKKVDRWVEHNPDSLLAKTIKEMTKRQKEKNKKRKQLYKNITTTNANGNSTATQLISPIDASIINSSLQMLITRDDNSDLAIW